MSQESPIREVTVLQGLCVYVSDSGSLVIAQHDGVGDLQEPDTWRAHVAIGHEIAPLLAAAMLQLQPIAAAKEAAYLAVSDAMYGARLKGVGDEA